MKGVGVRFQTVTGIFLFANTVFAPFLETSHILPNADANLFHESKAAEVCN
jgi:hypothetical protein